MAIDMKAAVEVVFISKSLPKILVGLNILAECSREYVHIGWCRLRGEAFPWVCMLPQSKSADL